MHSLSICYNNGVDKQNTISVNADNRIQSFFHQLTPISVCVAHSRCTADCKITDRSAVFANNYKSPLQISVTFLTYDQKHQLHAYVYRTSPYTLRKTYPVYYSLFTYVTAKQ